MSATATHLAPRTAFTSREAVRDYIAEKVLPRRRASGAREDLVGLESEFFVLRAEPGGLIRRPPIQETMKAIGPLGRWTVPPELAVGSPVLGIPWGGAITFEPGGQLEYSTPPFSSASASLFALERTFNALRLALKSIDAVLVGAGFDRWHRTAELSRQLRGPRYDAMEAYLRPYGDAGPQMMLQTASLQVNLDLNGDDAGRERWLLANLASPMATASFSTSPLNGLASQRARTWQGLDPARVGFPRLPPSGEFVDPGLEVAEMALGAGVIIFGHGEGSAAGSPEWSLERWIREGHPLHGWPTALDVDSHLTTLFPEVRLRGFLELRAVDSLPAPWRAAPVVFWTGLLYDATARKQALELLEANRCRLLHLWHRAACEGLRDRGLSSMAKEVWKLALEGARRRPAGFYADTHLRTAKRFQERFIQNGFGPGDELAEAWKAGPDRALLWALGDAAEGNTARFEIRASTSPL